MTSEMKSPARPILEDEGLFEQKRIPCPMRKKKEARPNAIDVVGVVRRVEGAQPQESAAAADFRAS